MEKAIKKGAEVQMVTSPKYRRGNGPPNSSRLSHKEEVQ